MFLYCSLPYTAVFYETFDFLILCMFYMFFVEDYNEQNTNMQGSES